MDSATPPSFRDAYLEQLPSWDGMPRVDTLLQAVFNLHLPTERDRMCSERAARSIMLGAVWRSFEPGAKLNESAVLMGAQGCGKSTFCRHLVPDQGGGRSAWFSDGVEILSSSSQDLIPLLTGRVVVECVEMAIRSRADADGIKAFLARRRDVVRMPFERLARSHPRTCVTIFTTNVERTVFDLADSDQHEALLGPLWKPSIPPRTHCWPRNAASGPVDGRDA